MGESARDEGAAFGPVRVSVCECVYKCACHWGGNRGHGRGKGKEPDWWEGVFFSNAEHGAFPAPLRA